MNGFLRSTVLAAAFGAVSFAAAPPAAAYPIDCAILLCLAGGFPASAECSAAKAEVIRRITPVPVEPPLQLWNCPMRLDPALAKEIGLTLALGADGLTDEARQYRDGIEIYQIHFVHSSRGDTDTLIDNTQVGDYHPETGDFFWKRSSYQDGPEWLATVAGGIRRAIYDDRCSDGGARWRCTPGPIGYKNDYRGRLRAIAMRFKDYEGKYHTEIVHY